MADVAYQGQPMSLGTRTGVFVTYAWYSGSCPQLLCTVFQQANAADFNQQKSNEQRRDHGDELPATEGRQGDQRDAQPQKNLAKIVGVTGSGHRPVVINFSALVGSRLKTVFW